MYMKGLDLSYIHICTYYVHVCVMYMYAHPHIIYSRAYIKSMVKSYCYGAICYMYIILYKRHE